MKISFKTIKLVCMFLVLPLVATAAATAHQLMVDSKPLTLDFEVPAVAESMISLDRTHTVAVNRNGDVEGRIAAIGESTASGLSNLNVFFVQNGEVVSETKTNSNGSFVATGIAEGPYSFVATGESGFVAYGVHVVSDASGKYDNVLEAAAVSPRFDFVKQVLDGFLPSEIATEILESSTSTGVGVVGSHRVMLDDGQLNGSVIALLSDRVSVADTAVHIIQNDKPVAEVKTDEAGNFSISDLTPGVYDFVASGKGGFAAMSFEAVGPTQNESDVFIPVSFDTSIPTNPVSSQDGVVDFGETLDVQLVGGQDVPFVSDQVDVVYREVDWMEPQYYSQPIEYAGEAFGGGGAVGGTYPTSPGTFGPRRRFGLFGGGGGNGGLGRLALLGGLAVGIVALADDDSDPISGS